MRAIRVGDKVQAFLNPALVGTVVNIIRAEVETYFVGGTAEKIALCDVELLSKEIVRVKMNDVYITDL